MTNGKRKRGSKPTLWLALAAGLLAGCAGQAGSETSSRIEAADRPLIAAATQAALETSKTGEGRTWVNPATGGRGTVIPTRTFFVSETPCREFQQTATIGGDNSKTLTAHDTACRNSNGRWQSENYASLDGAIADVRAGSRAAWHRHHGSYYGPYHPRFGYHPHYRHAYPRYSFGIRVGRGFGYRHHRHHYFGPHFGRYYY